MYGFLEHLDSRAAANLLLESIVTEARQQMIFRQFEGLFPMPVCIPIVTVIVTTTVGRDSLTSKCLLGVLHSGHHAEHGVDTARTVHHFVPREQHTARVAELPSTEHRRTYAHSLTILALRLVTLVQSNPNASALNDNNTPAITHNRSVPLSQPGHTLNLTWEDPGKQVGPDGGYNTSTSAGEGKVRFFRYHAGPLSAHYNTFAFALVCRVDFATEHHLHQPHRSWQQFWLDHPAE